MKKKTGSAFLAMITLALVMLSVPSSAHAVIITGDTANSEWGLGNFIANFTYNPSLAQLTVSLTNTSPAANGGYIMGFAFNNPKQNTGNMITGVSSWGYTDVDLDGGPSFDNTIGFSPFGKFDIGASVQNPQDGIGVGETETIIFNFTGSNLNTLTEDDFITTLSEPPGDGQGYQFFAVRFQGFENEGSDKVPGTTSPEPATLSLLGLGLLGIFGIRKRKS